MFLQWLFQILTSDHLYFSSSFAIAAYIYSIMFNSRPFIEHLFHYKDIENAHMNMSHF